MDPKKYAFNPSKAKDEASSLFDELFASASPSSSPKQSAAVNNVDDDTAFRKPALRKSPRKRREEPKPPSPDVLNEKKVAEVLPSISPPLLLEEESPDDPSDVGSSTSAETKTSQQKSLAMNRKRTANGTAKTSSKVDDLPFSDQRDAESSGSSGDSQGSLSVSVDSFHLSSPTKPAAADAGTSADAYDFEDEEIQVISTKRLRPISAQIGLRKAQSESALKRVEESKVRFPFSRIVL